MPNKRMAFWLDPEEVKKAVRKTVKVNRELKTASKAIRYILVEFLKERNGQE